ncbi:UvrD-helicase domain-containing protein [Pararhodospirillum oryzae]|uniref:DNA helicase n=1 Tax=Pararhodospirillum oryzae TaxID=478448 RepID=A0A512H9A5_9PROT|nr:UvrD-helicase domain-containing protein [Pararhodospirillum oryzae]GEO82039.1 DNA helicase [Pararhodospirillum oryzae]
MAYLADLHVHSKFSRATSRDLDLEHLAWWAARKGIAVVGTGDCVHPGWLREIKDKLVPTGQGLFRLRPEIEAPLWDTLPPACRAPVSFLLSTEISTIYKKDEKTRKVHHLIHLGDFDAADRLAAALARVGNIASDGRPILGLDSRDLLEITLASGPDSLLIPAHIWTPWFSALGAQSGFESIEACYGDLASHIVAVETGLSSDPAMNWRVSSLDRFRLVSNSDAHSPAKLGREATAFEGDPSYAGILHALATGEGYAGTVEFFPEEGKYHLDGHRTCGVRLDPAETLALGGRCPVCGKPLTVGVAHRVEVLADRARPVAPPTAGPVSSFVPLAEILGEILGVGSGSKAVEAAYDRLGAALGPELDVLGRVPVEDITRLHPLVGEAIARLRQGTVIREAGYDGAYGVIRLFEPRELAHRARGRLLFDDAPEVRPTKPARARKASRAEPDPAPCAPPSPPSSSPSPPPPEADTRTAGVLAGLDAEQGAAAARTEGPLVILAGPGSGKTRLLTHRIAHLVRDHGVPAPACLALTFTRKARQELESRLAALLPGETPGASVHTFHTLGLLILRAHGDRVGLPPDFRVADERERRQGLVQALGVSDARAGALLKALSLAKRADPDAPPPDPGVVAAREALDARGRAEGWVDFDDLVGLATALLETDDTLAARWRARFSHVLADEFQDVDPVQYRLLRCLAGDAGNVCVIGDPNQAIYGFRGADGACFERFRRDYPQAATVRLTRNYRSIASVVRAAAAVIGAPVEGVTRPEETPIPCHEAASEKDEAEFVATTLESLLGGHDMLGAHHPDAHAPARPLGFADVAVLYRTDAQADALREAFDRAGIPFQKSVPNPLQDHAGVRALMARLAAEGSEATALPLVRRLTQAATALDQDPDTDPAALAEARGWLAALIAENPGADLAGLAEDVALATEADFRDPRAERVSLLTLHAAKGLEFPVVFVVGLEDGLVPLGFSGRPPDPRTLAEERRLFYVALTRACDRLILSHARTRFWRGAVTPRRPSPFLAALPPALITTQAQPAAPPRPRQLRLF